MIVVQSVADLRAAVTQRRRDNGRVAFVPTMGNLHAGHLRLLQEARRLAPSVIVSIYVNPLQFGPDEDFNGYPRTPDRDLTTLESEGVAVLFAPDQSEVYPRGPGAQTTVEVPGLSDDLCGRVRPGHFRGVTTVVNRLFNLVQPDVAVFGKKDYQQWRLIRLMVADLGMPIEIVGVETVRDADGVALSSRNSYLTVEERKIAPRLYSTLRDVRDGLRKLGRADTALETAALTNLKESGFRPDYLSVRRQDNLKIPTATDRKLVILVAAWLGRARLIDNLEVDLS